MTQSADNNTTETIPTVPTTWPGAFGLLKHSKQAVRVNLMTVLVLAIMLALLSGGPNRWHHDAGYTVVLSVGTLLSSYVSLLMYYTLLKSIKGEKVSLGESLEASGLFINYFLTSLLSGLLVGVAFLLLVIPGFFVLPRLLLTSFFVIDQKLGPIQAVKASWAATEKHAGMLWGIIGAELAFALLFVTIIGIPFALYFLFMYSAALPIAYRYLTRSDQNAGPTTVEPVV